MKKPRIVQIKPKKKKKKGEIDRWIVWGVKFYSLDRLRERLLIRQGDDRHAFTGKSVVENEEEEEEGGLAPQFANFPQALCVGARPVNGLGDEVRERTRFGERRGGEADVRSNRLICARLARFDPLLPLPSSSPQTHLLILRPSVSLPRRHSVSSSFHSCSHLRNIQYVREHVELRMPAIVRATSAPTV